MSLTFVVTCMRIKAGLAKLFTVATRFGRWYRSVSCDTKPSRFLWGNDFYLVPETFGSCSLTELTCHSVSHGLRCWPGRWIGRRLWIRSSIHQLQEAKILSEKMTTLTKIGSEMVGKIGSFFSLSMFVRPFSRPGLMVRRSSLLSKQYLKNVW